MKISLILEALYSVCLGSVLKLAGDLAEFLKQNLTFFNCKMDINSSMYLRRLKEIKKHKAEVKHGQFTPKNPKV